MLECLDGFSVELQNRSKSLQVVALLFEIVQTNSLLLANTEKLKSDISKFTDFYDGVLETDLFLEIPRLLRHLEATNVVRETFVNITEFPLYIKKMLY